MNSCKYCGETRRNHDFSGLCKDHENFYDNGEEDRRELKERRERIATASLAKLMHSDMTDCDMRDYVELSTQAADALIKALDEVKP